MAMLVKIDGHRTSGRYKELEVVILTKLGQHVNEMMAVAVNKFSEFFMVTFCIIRQNVNMATNAILCGLPPKLQCFIYMLIQNLARAM